MIRLEQAPFRDMAAHAESSYPDECVGAMIGSTIDGRKVVETSLRLENSAEGSQRAYYELKPEHLMKADRAARELELDFTLEKVKDFTAIADMGIVVTPALAIDGEVRLSGRVPTLEELKGILGEGS